MYRLLPFLFLLAISPESDKKMENFNSFIMATKESVASIKNGLENFHSAAVPLMKSFSSGKTGQAAGRPPGGEENNFR